MTQKASKQKPFFFEGQKELGASLFGANGPLRALLTGAPDVGYEAGVNRGLQQLNRNQAGQGIYGQPLAQRAAADYIAQSNVGREQNRLQTLLSAVSPMGALGKGSQPGALDYALKFVGK